MTLQELKGLSVCVVETIVAWKSSRVKEQSIFASVVETGKLPSHSRKAMQATGDKSPVFLWGGYHYLRKMLNDVDFLATSALLVRTTTKLKSFER